MKIKTSQLYDSLLTALKAKLVPMVFSPPGVGKSAIVKSLAKDLKLKVIDLRLAQCDPVDLNGFPMRNIDNTASYIPIDVFPIETTKIPEGYTGWLLFLDELSSAPPEVQAAAYKIILDKQVGTHNLHRNVAIVAAGNNVEDGAVAYEMSTALQSRLINLEVEVDKDSWITWALSNNFDERIISFIQFDPAYLHKFSEDNVDKTFPCPRTWEFVNKLLKVDKDILNTNLALVAGAIGDGSATAFKAYCEVYADLPNIEDIMKDPENTQIPSDPSTLFALSGSIIYRLIEHKDNDIALDKLMTYIRKLPAEFQVMIIKATCSVVPDIIKNDSIDSWIIEFSDRI